VFGGSTLYLSSLILNDKDERVAKNKSYVTVMIDEIEHNGEIETIDQNMKLVTKPDLSRWGKVQILRLEKTGFPKSIALIYSLEDDYTSFVKEWNTKGVAASCAIDPLDPTKKQKVCILNSQLKNKQRLLAQLERSSILKNMVKMILVGTPLSLVNRSLASLKD